MLKTNLLLEASCGSYDSGISMISVSMFAEKIGLDKNALLIAFAYAQNVCKTSVIITSMCKLVPVCGAKTVRNLSEFAGKTQN